MSEPEKNPRKRKQKEQDPQEDTEHMQASVPKHKKKGKQDIEDDHKEVPVQVPAAKLIEIKQQWDEVKRLIKENRPHLSMSAVMFVTILAVAGCLAYAGWRAHEDLAMRQQKIIASQGGIFKSVKNEMKELKSHLGEAVKTSLADEIKLLRNIENSIKRLEDKVKAIKH